jgi:hypothetical protein
MTVVRSTPSGFGRHRVDVVGRNRVLDQGPHGLANRAGRSHGPVITLPPTPTPTVYTSSKDIGSLCTALLSTAVVFLRIGASDQVTWVETTLVF